MIRKTISFLVLTVLLATGLAFASSEPVAAPSEPAPPVLLDLQALLSGDSCTPQPASVKPGCSRLCQVAQDCRYYPEESCVNGCCVF